MMKLVGEAFRNDPLIFVDQVKKIAYYHILYKISAAIITEFQSETSICKLGRADLTEDIYNIFEALRFNIIIR